ncbi:hypothetical protein F1C10_01805 [Sphingomonas sp. NBWT7]|uniref:hypothetical protein n=1 Tax=Sphingomonas sp. NBWT7 TaxID=2596913 RepID=UPI00162AADE9|nr:hypothetical protein [Sphingomonas sp. NBWT7]QNE30826.1 hypothetical protein F1C10_01805 [Sphingomonas sp. NBWT7]
MIAASGVAAGRWTRLHPLVAATLVAILPAVLAVIAMAGFMADARSVYGAGLLAFVAAAGIAAFGAFLGWLRRKHVEGIG